MTYEIPECFPDDAKDLCRSMQLYINELEEMLRLLRRQKFGPSSEKQSHEGMKPLFPDEQEEQAPATPPEPPQKDVKAYSRKAPRKAFPDDIPREEIIIDLDEGEKNCGECQHGMKKVGEKVSEKLHLVPAKVVVKKFIRPVYSCKKCEQMKQQPMPPHPIEKCGVTPETLAHILVAKYVDGMPLYRLEQVFQRMNVDITRDKMSRWVIALAEQARPVKELCHQRLLASDCIGMDETGFQVNREKGRTASQKSFMLVQANIGPPGGARWVVFHYDPSRAKAAVADYLRGYKGQLVTDGLEVYASLCRASPYIAHGGCWSHVRRKFAEVVKASKNKRPPIASEFIRLIGSLFEVEEGIKDAPLTERSEQRQLKSKPILDEMEELLAQKLTSVPRKSLTGKALHYLNGQWQNLVRFLSYPRLPIHNNHVEQQIRPFATGRKAWLFADTVDGAEASATFYTLLMTAKLNGLNPYEYACHFLRNLPHSDPSELLPVKMSS